MPKKPPRPLRNLVLCRALTREELDDRIGLIYLPQSTEDAQRHMQWVVESVGDGVYEDEIVPGCRVIIGSMRGYPCDLDRDPYMFVAEENIQALVDEE